MRGEGDVGELRDAGVYDEVEPGWSCGVFQDGGGSFIFNRERFEDALQIPWSCRGSCFHCDTELVAGNSCLLKPLVDGGYAFGKGLFGELDGSWDTSFE
jgi:hypothetical protein